MTRAIFFDLFNTLVSVGKVPEHVGRFTADILGIDRDTWNEACFGPHHEVSVPTSHIEVIAAMANSIDPSIPDHLVKQAAVERQRRFDHALLNAEQEILISLQQLRDVGFRLGLISNASTAEVMAWNMSALAESFETSVFSCECGMQKPEPAIYEYAARLLGVDPTTCIYVGDGGSYEFNGASRAGMHTILTKHFLKTDTYKKVSQEQGDNISSEIDHINQLYQRLTGMDSEGNKWA